MNMLRIATVEDDANDLEALRTHDTKKKMD